MHRCGSVNAIEGKNYTGVSWGPVTYRRLTCLVPCRKSFGRIRLLANASKNLEDTRGKMYLLPTCIIRFINSFLPGNEL